MYSDLSTPELQAAISALRFYLAYVQTHSGAVPEDPDTTRAVLDLCTRLDREWTRRQTAGDAGQLHQPVID